MERFWKTTIMVCLLYLASAMVAAPVACVHAAQNAVRLCLEVVIPSLFPFFVCSNLFIALGAANVLSRYLSRFMRPLFGVPGGGALAMVLGVISGYPVGASCAARLYTSGSCTKTEAERLLAFCNNSGPLFILGAVGIGMLGSQKLGILLYTAHVGAALLTGLLFRGYGRKIAGSAGTALPPAPAQGMRNAAASVGTAVADAVDSIFKVCGFVILFAVFAAALPTYPGSQFIYALLEITGGIKTLLGLQGLGGLLLPLVSLFLAFSGISVLLQVAGIVMPSGLSVRPYIFGKLTQAVLAFGLTLLLLRLFPVEWQTFAPETMLLPVPTPRELFATAVLSLLWCAIAIGVLVAAVWISDWIERRKKRK